MHLCFLFVGFEVYEGPSLCVWRGFMVVLFCSTGITTHTHTHHSVSNICSKIEHYSEIFICHLKESFPLLAFWEELRLEFGTPVESTVSNLGTLLWKALPWQMCHSKHLSVCSFLPSEIKGLSISEMICSNISLERTGVWATSRGKPKNLSDSWVLDDCPHSLLIPLTGHCDHRRDALCHTAEEMTPGAWLPT